MCRGAIRRSEPPGRQELVLAHEAQHALAADGQAPVGQARPHFTIAFAMERRRREDLPDRRDEREIAGDRRGVYVAYAQLLNL